MVTGLKLQFENASQTQFDLGTKSKLIKLYDHLIKLAQKKHDNETDVDKKIGFTNRINELTNIKTDFESKTTASTPSPALNIHIANLINYSDLRPKGYANKLINHMTTPNVIKGGSESVNSIKQLDNFYNSLNQQKDNYTVSLKNTVKSYERIFNEIQGN